MQHTHTHTHTEAHRESHKQVFVGGEGGTASARSQLFERRSRNRNRMRTAGHARNAQTKSEMPAHATAAERQQNSQKHRGGVARYWHVGKREGRQPSRDCRLTAATALKWKMKNRAAMLNH